MDTRKTIGANIRRYRTEIQWTQEKLAVRLKVTNEFICRLEKGTEYPSIRLLEKMAKLMNRKLIEFFIER
jgi:transcriptional regulator with XRE-family HTH domain